MKEVFADPHTATRNMIQEYQYPGENPLGALAGNPIKFKDSPASFHHGPPKHGEHTEEVLAEFGLLKKEE